MKRTLSLATAAFLAATLSAQAAEPLAKDFVNPESVCYGPDGSLYVSEIGKPGVDGDGQIAKLSGDDRSVLATGLNDPKGIVFFKDALYVTDKTRVMKVDLNGQTSVYLDADKFPSPPQFLNDIAIEAAQGVFLVSDSGLNGKGQAVYRIDAKSGKVDTLADTTTIPGLVRPNGVAFDGESHCLVADFDAGFLYRVKFADRSAEKIAEGLDGGDGLVWDMFGRLFISSWKTGKVFAIPRAGEQPILIAEGFQSAADCCLSKEGDSLIVPDMKAGTLNVVSTKIPGWEVDQSPIAVEAKPAFPNLKWAGWENEDESGKPTTHRPIVLTHAGDGSNRVFVATQYGVIHVFDNDDDAKETKIFLDISDRVKYDDKKNEEGFLGLAFHPKFEENGEFFVFYTDRKADLQNVVSRFRLKGDVGDPASEEEILRYEKPFWNHDGGCIAFGPDGYLYISHGDGGSGGDPHKNGQNLGTWLGKVLRIDVDKKADGKNYAIPADNPFVGKDGALPEIYAYGLRNVWRMAFDPATGVLWGGEVGQNRFEEIILIEKGGNYGWSVREAFHPFGADGVGVRPELIEPIWEYDHEIGKSITGGAVYRGKKVPALVGAYVYSDYVSQKFWALVYDAEKGRVVANRPIATPGIAALSFGEDEEGEIYVLRTSVNGQGIFRLEATGEANEAAGK